MCISRSQSRSKVALNIESCTACTQWVAISYALPIFQKLLMARAEGREDGKSYHTIAVTRNFSTNINTNAFQKSCHLATLD